MTQGAVAWGGHKSGPGSCRSFNITSRMLFGYSKELENGSWETL